MSDDLAWNDLRISLDPRNNIEAVKGILAHLKSLGAQSVVIENEYLDQDFTAEFARFYATVFKRYSKVCKRLHFFAADVSPILALNEPEKLSEGLEEAGKRSYLGFSVVRPLTHAPLGRTVLVGPVSPADRGAKLLVRANYSVHLLGAEMTVRGFPFAQQDSRISSCAQATIWMAGRHFHVEHRGPWFSTVDITEAASQPTDQTLAQSLPAGSGFLDVNNMVRALRAMGREPFAYIAPTIDYKSTPAKIDWGSKLRPREIVSRYVDSGIPVILGLARWEQNQTVGHAIVAVGHTVKRLDPSFALPDRPTRAEFTESFLVNDDQRGVTLQMPLVAGAGVGETPYSMENVQYLIVPLPKKVFINAESAETIAWQLLQSHFQTIWTELKTNYAVHVAPVLAAGDEFAAQIKGNALVARTYLTFGWKYKARILRNSIPDGVKTVILQHQLPKFVWVTEFGLFNDLNHLDAKDRKIISHSVIDATSSNFWHGVSVFHAPGFIMHWSHDPQNPTAEFKQQTTVIPSASTYRPKIRGTLTI